MKTFIASRSLAILAAVVIVASPAQAALTVGDSAPKLQVGKWVQGDPLTEFDSKHVYVVEFWSTWCGPCRQSIPHLNELHEKFKDKGLIAIGQDVWENDDSGVAAFVKKMGKQMTYRVALDDKSKDKKGAMAAAWMQAAGQNGIPTAFVVNKQGKIAWIGHPMGLKEQMLEEIIAGKFDVAKSALEYEQQQEVERQHDALYKKLGNAMQQKDWDAAEAAAVEVEKSMPEPARFLLGNTRLQILLGRKDYDAAYKLAESATDEHKDNVDFQNGLAWTLATHEGLDKRSLLLAEKIAERANTATQGKSSAILDTLARVQFRLGKKQEAIATEQKAIDACKDEEEKSSLKKTLADYQQGKLPKEDK